MAVRRPARPYPPALHFHLHLHLHLHHRFCRTKETSPRRCAANSCRRRTTTTATIATATAATAAIAPASPPHYLHRLQYTVAGIKECIRLASAAAHSRNSGLAGTAAPPPSAASKGASAREGDRERLRGAAAVAVSSDGIELEEGVMEARPCPGGGGDGDGERIPARSGSVRSGSVFGSLSAALFGSGSSDAAVHGLGELAAGRDPLPDGAFEQTVELQLTPSVLFTELAPRVFER